jgi:hypothetical protein
VQDRSNTIWDEIGSFEVYFIDLFIRELALTSVDVLQRHHEDHRGLSLFIGPLEKVFPGIRSEPHRASETVHPRLPERLVAVRINLVDWFDPE